MPLVGLRKLDLVFTLLVLSTVHSAPAPAPARDCNNVVLSLAGCLSYVSLGSKREKPEATCCAGLKSVLKTSAETGGVDCLCNAFKNSGQYGLTVDMKRAGSLPAACDVTTFSVEGSCHIGPAAAPVPAPSPLAISPRASVPGTPSALVPGTPSALVPGTPSASAPGSSGSSSSSLAAPIELLVLTTVAAVIFTSLY